MNALVRIILLVIIAFLMLVNLMLLAGESTGLGEKLALAVPAVLLVWAAFAFAVALTESHDGPPVVLAVVAGRGRPPQAAARRAGLEFVEKVLTTTLTSTCRVSGGP